MAELTVEQVRESALQLLQKRGELRWSRIDVDVDETSIVLEGRVSSYYKKQLAQETLRPLLGGQRKLKNRLEVD